MLTTTVPLSKSVRTLESSVAFGCIRGRGGFVDGSFGHPLEIGGAAFAGVLFFGGGRGLPQSRGELSSTDCVRRGIESLAEIFDGWNGYQASLVHAVEPLTAAQLAWRPAADRRSVGELVRHLALGRVTWFARMGGPGLEHAIERVPEWWTDGDGVAARGGRIGESR